MGLDITAYAHLTLCDPQIEEDDEGIAADEAYERGLFRVYVDDVFAERLGSLESGKWYEPGGRYHQFRAGSYHGYNAWRDELCQRAHSVPPSTIWTAREDYVGTPFYELIDFSDCEGCIGPEVSRKLSLDFVANRSRVFAWADWKSKDDEEWFETLYDEWSLAFAMAAINGCVQFH